MRASEKADSKVGCVCMDVDVVVMRNLEHLGLGDTWRTSEHKRRASENSRRWAARRRRRRWRQLRRRRRRVFARLFAAAVFSPGSRIEEDGVRVCVVCDSEVRLASS